VKITADTNLLLRAIVEDEPLQALEVQTLMERAELIAVPLPVLCDVVWTLRRLYKRSTNEIRDNLCTVTEIIQQAITSTWPVSP
jgi:predicted nucleic-acid-binding protein